MTANVVPSSSDRLTSAKAIAFNRARVDSAGIPSVPYRTECSYRAAHNRLRTGNTLAEIAAGKLPLPIGNRTDSLSRRVARVRWFRALQIPSGLRTENSPLLRPGYETKSRRGRRVVIGEASA